MPESETTFLQALVAIAAGYTGGIPTSPLVNSAIQSNSCDSEYTSLQKLVQIFSGVGGGLCVPDTTITNAYSQTTDPHVAGQLWNNGGFLCFSQG